MSNSSSELGAASPRRTWLFLAALASACGAPSTQQAPPPGAESEPASSAELPPGAAEAVAALFERARRDESAWRRLATLCDTFGARPTGSASLEAALEWAVETMKRDGLENVRLEPVTAPVWERGEESLVLLEPHGPRRLPMLGRGRSIGTPPEGIEAEVVVVDDFDHLDRLGRAVSGKIVLYDVPMPERDNMFQSYGETVVYRSRGASRAAAYGAVAVLVRSLTTRSLATPHTGALRYDDGGRRIPAAAVTIEDAAMMRRLAERGVPIRVRLTMQARSLEPVQSFNAIGEVRGRELPDEVVVIGGHIDSWDVGTGAHDDGAGVIIAMESLRLLRELDLRPRRTVRAVLFTNEESGLAGGLAYRDDHRHELDRHVAAMESDSGAFRPIGFGFQGSDAALARVRELMAVFEPYGGREIFPGHSGADIGPIVRLGVPGFGLAVESEHYFDIHHTAADTPDKVDPDELAEGVASFASMAWLLAELDPPLARLEPDDGGS